MGASKVNDETLQGVRSGDGRVHSGVIRERPDERAPQHSRIFKVVRGSASFDDGVLTLRECTDDPGDLSVEALPVYFQGTASEEDHPAVVSRRDREDIQGSRGQRPKPHHAACYMGSREYPDFR